MRDLVEQMETASNAGLYFPALIAALTVPDICGALSSDNGRASGSKYKGWLQHWVRTIDHGELVEYMDAPTAELVYGFRCSLLHQGSAHPDGGGPPIAFIEPGHGAPQLHQLSTVVGEDTVYWISVPIFIEQVSTAVTRWWAAHGESTTVMRNMERYVRRRPDGLPPHVGGTPVIA